MSTETASAPSAKPAKTDWEAVERDYRAGLLSLREIAGPAGITEGAIRKRAKVNGWERNLTAKVNEKVRNDLVRAEVRAAHRESTEREIIDQAAATVVQVVRSHRTRISKHTELVELLSEQLVSAAGKREDIEDVIFDETALDKDGKRRSAMMRAVSLPTHASTAVNLANALKTLIGLERQAFSIKDESEAPIDPLATLLSRVNGTALPVVAAAEPDDE